MEDGAPPAVIARHQAVLLIVLVLASAIMGGLLWRQLDRAHQHRLIGQDSTPTQAPEVAPAEPATLLVANDLENSLIAETQTLPLPQDSQARARLILGKLLDLYASPDALHPVPGGASSVAQVFLMPLSGPRLEKPEARSVASRLPNAHPAPPRHAQPEPSPTTVAGPQLAVVNLTAAFAAGHPSGIETETLTILSLCGTLHANLPRVAEVRFLVDGQPRATLAGHADLTRTYLAADAVPTEGAHP
jgi:hypothetical protein